MMRSKQLYGRILFVGLALAISIFLLTSAIEAQNFADGDGIIEPGENATEELAKAAQNPVAALISLPFQNNTNVEYGPDRDVQNVLNIQPVIPFQLSNKWKVD